MSRHIEGPLHAQRSGIDGPVMLFVHPNPYDHSAWMYQLTHFATWYRCVAVDLPGFGRSPKAHPGLTLDDLADACWDAVDAVDGQGQAILSGVPSGRRSWPECSGADRTGPRPSSSRGRARGRRRTTRRCFET